MNDYLLRWWHKSGYWTRGRFYTASLEEASEIIACTGGTHITCILDNER